MVYKLGRRPIESRVKTNGHDDNDDDNDDDDDVQH